MNKIQEEIRLAEIINRIKREHKVKVACEELLEDANKSRWYNENK